MNEHLLILEGQARQYVKKGWGMRSAVGLLGVAVLAVIDIAATLQDIRSDIRGGVSETTAVNNHWTGQGGQER